MTKVKYKCDACGDRVCEFVTNTAVPKGLVPEVCPFSPELLCEWVPRKTLKEVGNNG